MDPHFVLIGSLIHSMKIYLKHAVLFYEFIIDLNQGMLATIRSTLEESRDSPESPRFAMTPDDQPYGQSQERREPIPFKLGEGSSAKDVKNVQTTLKKKHNEKCNFHESSSDNNLTANNLRRHNVKTRLMSEDSLSFCHFF